MIALNNKIIKYSLYFLTVFIILISVAKSGFTGENKYEIAGFENSERVIIFVKDLQKSVKQNDVKHIASLVRYPLFVDIKGERVAITKKIQFINNYSNIFDSTVRTAVLNADPEALFANSKGVMIGRGEIWLASLSSKSKKMTLIITVNNNSN